MYIALEDKIEGFATWISQFIVLHILQYVVHLKVDFYFYSISLLWIKPKCFGIGEFSEHKASKLTLGLSLYLCDLIV